MTNIFFNQKTRTTAFLFFLILLGFIYYLPIIKKGYPASLNTNNLIIAKNLHLTGSYSIENDKGILLSSANIKKEGVRADTGNKLTSLIYAEIFNLTGFQPNLPLILAIICFTLSNILFFLLILKRFNILLAVIFSLTLGLVPVFWQGALIGGFYELAILFFTLGIFCYFYKKENNYWDLLISGLFLGLAVACRNAFLISIVPFLIFEIFKNRSLKRIIIFSLPIFLIFITLVLPNNFYFKKSESFAMYSHAFSDPYTYIFAKDEFINKTVEGSKGDVLDFLILYGYKPTFGQKFGVFLNSILFTLKEFFRLVTFGGPLIIALLIFGLVWSKYKFKDFYLLSAIWLIIWFGGLTIIGATNWDHFLEILFPVVLLISFGILWLIEIINQVFSEKKVKFFIFLVLTLAFIGHLIVASKWMFHEEYNTSKGDVALTLIDKINHFNFENDKGVIAFGDHNDIMYQINYYTDKNIVKFDPETIRELLVKEELQKAFDYFNVGYIIGYNPQLTEEIIAKTKVKNIP